MASESSERAARLRGELQAAFTRSDEIFALLSADELFERPIALRHPFIFYVGHLAAFAWNQIGAGALGHGPLSRELDVLFERGIDPADETRARSASIAAWPQVSEVLAYRDRVRSAVVERVPEVLARRGDVLCENARVVQMVIEHELMHHETLAYMLQEHTTRGRRRPPTLPALVSGPGRAAEPRRIPGGDVTLGARFDAVEFGWDNEFGHRVEAVRAFSLDSLPVRNRDYLTFLGAHAGAARDALTPAAWITDDRHAPRVKTVFGPVAFAVAEGWPVQVSGVQARAYCEAHGGRLPTDGELHHIFHQEEHASPRGNYGFRAWAPVPVGSDRSGPAPLGVEELVGNGWEWTSTPFAPLPGFTAYARTYPGYSADFFDGEHDVVFGASWATDARLLRPSFRNWYRRDYPYVFSSFRVARDD